MEIEEKLVAVFKTVMDEHTELNLSTGIANLNANSMQAVMLVSQIEEQFSLSLPMQEYYSCETLSDLARYITRNM